MNLTIPLLLPFVFIVLLLFAGNNMLRKILGISGTALLLINAVLLVHRVKTEGIQCMNAGGWPAPFAIPLVADMFSAIMILATAIVALCTAVFSCAAIDEDRHAAHYFALFFGVLMGVNGTYLAGDIFNMYVWIELMLISSFGIMALGGERYQLEGTLKYLALNLIASLLFLAGVGFLYSQTGTVNMAALAEKFAAPGAAHAGMTAAAMLLFIAIGIKSAFFPFYNWLPASYHTPPVAVTALFAGLLTKTGVYMLFRIFTLFFRADRDFWLPLFLLGAGLTMVVAGISATSQTEIRRILSFSLVCQMGYMLMGLGIFTRPAVAGAIFFMFHSIIAKTNAFLIAGIIDKQGGSFHLGRLGGLYGKFPWLAVLFAIAAATQAGIPPFSGFAGKFFLVKAGFENSNFIIAGTAIMTSLLTLIAMLKIWNRAFWQPAGEGFGSAGDMSGRLTFFLYTPAVLLALLSIILGLGAGYFIELCLNAAGQLLDSSEYIDKVMHNIGIMR